MKDDKKVIKFDVDRAKRFSQDTIDIVDTK